MALHSAFTSVQRLNKVSDKETKKWHVLQKKRNATEERRTNGNEGFKNAHIRKADVRDIYTIKSN